MKNTNQHSGEVAVQQLRGISVNEANPSWYISDEIPKQHADFFANLLYFPFGAIDKDGTLWASILVNPVVKILSKVNMQIQCSINEKDPFLNAVLGSQYFAAVGVDFTNQRRNKVNGKILSAVFADRILTLILQADENMGNCPKYITVRNLEYCERKAGEPVIMDRLNMEAQSLINKSSTMFMVTKHMVGDSSECDLGIGFNHRGGARGFMRYYKDKDVGKIVLPDYSGNRFFQSLGNIQSDGAAGLVIPDFETGDMLHVTGSARNVFGKEADSIMPRMSLITIIEIQKAILIKGGLNLCLVGNEVLSPYNPPIRLLRNEMKATEIFESGTPISLVKIEKLSSKISTFTFTYPSSLNDQSCVPGSYGIIDFSHIFIHQYQHMNNANPKLVNDDSIRTWTVSHFDKQKKQFSVTVKLAGRISRFLHSLKQPVLDGIYLKGFGGEFSCFPDVPQKMVWFAAGVGITPFMSMYNSLDPNMRSRVTLVFSCRGDEALLLKDFKAVIKTSISKVEGLKKQTCL
ncbi:hypothetical protein HK103_002620 [Boothiomyces macroporosus]|uniref:FAD-binding FR-type domain-containing protein n=1 Tax=Boothiomyces macroporosus TaxID=261099 RepID=A0AAD5Y4N6_9FUNG|nr:hypothetical protein HK103_002620 [Boothiomyces macroporosus]